MTSHRVWDIVRGVVAVSCIVVIVVVLWAQSKRREELELKKVPDIFWQNNDVDENGYIRPKNDTCPSQ